VKALLLLEELAKQNTKLIFMQAARIGRIQTTFRHVSQGFWPAKSNVDSHSSKGSQTWKQEQDADWRRYIMQGYLTKA
jgi:hypothetical protein